MNGHRLMADQRLVSQTQKLKDARTAVVEKLEVYRLQYEEMQVRALAAEVEVTSHQLQLENLREQLAQSEENVKIITDQLNAQRQVSSEQEKTLQKFQRKLSRIRTALTREVNKLRHSKNDLRVAFDSVMRCVLEFRNEAISKDDFLCAIDLIFSTVLQQQRTSLHSSAKIETVFGDMECEKLASLSKDLRKSRLAELMSMLSEKELTTDDDSQSQDEDTPSPPPLPPKDSFPTKKTPTENVDYSPNSPRKLGTGVGIYSIATHPDSDSDSSDFEHFVPPVRPRKRYRSEPQCNIHAQSPFRRGSSPFPMCNVHDQPQRSVVLTREPSWLENKQSKANIVRSKSLDAVSHLAIAATTSAPDRFLDSDDNTSTMDSTASGYARPFEHLKSWAKVLGVSDMNSILTGSLPQIDKACEDSDSSGGYLDPSEIEVAVFRTESKLNRRVSRRLRKRVDTILTSSNDIYMSLVNTLPKGKPTAATPDSTPVTPVTPYIPMQMAIASAEMWRRKSLGMPSGNQSGYNSDASSTEWLDKTDECVYAEIQNGPLAKGSNNAVYPFPAIVTDGIYEELDDHQSKKRAMPSSCPLDESQGGSFKSQDSYCHLHDTLERVTFNLGPQLPMCSFDKPPIPPPRKPAPPPRRKNVSREEMDPTKLIPPWLGNLPLYTTLRGNHRRIQLVALSPTASADEHVLSDNEHYSLGKFVAVESDKKPPKIGDPKRRATHSVSPDLQLITASGSDAGEERDNMPQRSHTFCAASSSKFNSQENSTAVEKSGYLNKMDPKKKHWTKRWFVLKGSQLKYYKTKESFFGLNRPRGTIDLASWCRLTRDETTATFQLATPKRTYHLLANSNQDCEEWVRVLQMSMETPMENSCVKPKAPTVSGWARMSHKNGLSQKVWCELDQTSLSVSTKPGEKPLRQIGMHQTTIKKVRDSLLMDSSRSTGNLHSPMLAITAGEETTYFAPEAEEEKDSWYYHLNEASSGDLGPEVTQTERLLAQIMQEGGGTNHSLWKHPLLNCTADPFRNALTSLPSASLRQAAKVTFQLVQLFMSTPINPLCPDYHMVPVQQLLHSGLKHHLLQNEIYCQVLRQISGHTIPTSSTVVQGWYLLFLMIPIFLPNKKFLWYLRMFLEQHVSSSNPTIVEYAQQCQLSLQKAEKNGPRECKPSTFELQGFMSRCVHMPTVLQTTLRLPIYLMDGTTQEVEFTPFTTVCEIIIQLHQNVGMPDVSSTGFALMSDWPGVEDPTCYHLFPKMKLCDVISMWSESMDTLNQMRVKQHRSIMLTYWNRLSLRSHRGHETDREALLLAYQLSKEVLSGRHPVSSTAEGIKMAAIMAQIEYGDWSGVEGSSERDRTAREALQRFCPSKFTHLALEHDQSILRRTLVEQWNTYSGMSQQQCAHMYLTLAQQWPLYGATLFQAEEWFSSNKLRSIWLAVHEDGVSLLDSSSMECLVSYSYNEVSTFGCHGDTDFVLVVSPQQQISPSERGKLLQSEKLLLTMPKLKIREATFLMASYLESHDGVHPCQSSP